MEPCTILLVVVINGSARDVQAETTHRDWWAIIAWPLLLSIAPFQFVTSLQFINWPPQIFHPPPMHHHPLQFFLPLHFDHTLAHFPSWVRINMGGDHCQNYIGGGVKMNCDGLEGGGVMSWRGQWWIGGGWNIGGGLMDLWGWWWIGRGGGCSLIPRNLSDAPSIPLDAPPPLDGCPLSYPLNAPSILSGVLFHSIRCPPPINWMPPSPPSTLTTPAPTEYFVIILAVITSHRGEWVALQLSLSVEMKITLGQLHNGGRGASPRNPVLSVCTFSRHMLSI